MIAMNGTRHAIDRARAPQRGVSLVELMISLVIGLLILAAMVALFVNTSGGNRQMAQANNVIENGRLAIELLEGSKPLLTQVFPKSPSAEIWAQ